MAYMPTTTLAIIRCRRWEQLLIGPSPGKWIGGTVLKLALHFTS